MRYLMFAVLAMLCSPAFAQMYRCGTQFQDRPCETNTSAAPTSKNAVESGENRAAREHADEERRKAYERYPCARYDQDLQNIHDATDLPGQNMEALDKRAHAVAEQRKFAGCS
ncbi:MAG TPA: hypothetical protein VJM53_08755 [Burkholderiales bacterium]|nr:hypothetical protein [Burkholderiales bacterium]